MVEFDISQALVRKVEIQWGLQTFVLPIEYWKVPFRCRLCREVGHFKKDFLELEFRAPYLRDFSSFGLI